MKTIEIYSTPTCHFCHVAKDFFNDHNVSFTDYNVADDMDKRKESIELSGQMGVPVISITDEAGEQTIIVGFNEPVIREKLGISE